MSGQGFLFLSCNFDVSVFNPRPVEGYRNDEKEMEVLVTLSFIVKTKGGNANYSVTTPCLLKCERAE